MKEIIIDVRTPEEYAQGHVENSLNIDFYGDEFLSQIQKLDKTPSYKLYCRSGNRSGQAEALMKQLGFKSVVNIGGLDDVSQDYKFV